jgi:hypothetical protein
VKFIFFISIYFLFLSESYGRVFSFENESIAPYFNLKAGLPTMGTTPIEWQSVDHYSGDKINFLYGGEFGVYIKGGALGMSLGILVDTFDPIRDGKGLDSAGTQLYSVNTTGIAYGPTLQFDYQISNIDNYLWKLMIGGGYQFSKIDNEYSYSSAGQILAGGQTSSIESYKSNSPFAVVGVSTEFLMSGTTTLSIMLGYHYNFQKNWKYSGGTQNVAGVQTDGSDVLSEDGTFKQINWSYPFLQMGFQFYVDKVQ